jgi:hypothetical protein
MRFQIFKVVETWSTGVHVVIVCDLVDGYQHFRETYCLCLHSTLTMGTTVSCKTPSTRPHDLNLNYEVKKIKTCGQRENVHTRNFKS